MLPDASFTATMFSISDSRFSVGVSILIAVRPCRLYAIIGIFTAVADGFEVLIQTFLRGLVVIRGDGQNSVRAHVLHFFGELDHFRGVVTARAADNGHLALGLFKRDFDDAQMFFARKRRILTSRPTGHQKIDPRVDLPPDEPPQRGLIERALSGTE